MKVAFDEELNSDDIETLRKLLLKLRNPVSMTNTFAFSHCHLVAQPHQLHMKVKEKNASLKYDSFYFMCYISSINVT
jgi:myotubularin-related protein 5/13